MTAHETHADPKTLAVTAEECEKRHANMRSFFVKVLAVITPIILAGVSWCGGFAVSRFSAISDLQNKTTVALEKHESSQDARRDEFYRTFQELKDGQKDIQAKVVALQVEISAMKTSIEWDHPKPSGE
jgi:hypothetical protein